MTAARLEELAVWAASVANQHDQLKQAKLRDIYADLARCARAWAKVESVIRAEDGWSVDLWRMSTGHIRMLTNKQSCDGPTALEAVEAAEVTDANKG